MDTSLVRGRVEEFIRRHELIPSGGEVTCLVSGGADSTCLWHVLRELGYGVSALHVDHGLRGEESDADARLCAEQLKAEIADGRGGHTEDELRKIRYSVATDRLRATGHTASDQVETVLYRLVASGTAKGIKPRREDGVVRPLLTVWREETQAYCRAEGLEFRLDRRTATRNGASFARRFCRGCGISTLPPTATCFASPPASRPRWTSCWPRPQDRNASTSATV
jgi:tRNA(Ile)-lysidine synthase